MVLRATLAALSEAPGGTTDIGNVAASVMSGRGGGRGARTGPAVIEHGCELGTAVAVRATAGVSNNLSRGR